MREMQTRTRRRHESVMAVLTWVSPNVGGRKTPPTVRCYRSLSRFDEDPNWSRGVWDILVEFIDLPTFEAPSKVRISFASPGAPTDLLHTGNRFELREGKKVVARGQIDP